MSMPGGSFFLHGSLDRLFVLFVVGKIVFDFIDKGFSRWGHVFMLQFSQPAEQFFFFFSNPFGDFDVDLHQHVSQTGQPNIGHSLASKPKDIAGLGPRRYFHLTSAMERRHFQQSAQNRLGIGYGNATDQVLAFPFEQWMPQYGNKAVAIARGAALAARFSLTCNANLHAIVDARGNLNFRLDFLECLPRTPTKAAGCTNRMPCTMTRGTSGLHADNARRLNHLAMTAAVGTCFVSATWHGTRPLAGIARLMTLKLDRLVDPEGRLLQRKRHVTTNIAALAGAAPATSEKIAKDISKGGENILHICEVVRSTLSIDTSVPKLVIPGPLFRVAQDLEGVGRLLEPRDGILIPRIFVRVVLDGHFAIRSSDHIVRCGSLNPQDFVIIAWRGHGDQQSDWR